MKSRSCIVISALAALFLVDGSYGVPQPPTKPRIISVPPPAVLDPKECQIDLRTLSQSAPLLLSSVAGQTDFVYPANSATRQIIYKTGESVRVACPGSHLNVNSKIKLTDTLLKCIGSNIFELPGTEFKNQMSEILCAKTPEFMIRPSIEKCGANRISVEIGFLIQPKPAPSGQFIRLIGLCHDFRNHNTIRAHTKIMPSIGASQTGAIKMDFIKKYFEDIPIPNLYQRPTQQSTIARIVQSTDPEFKYVKSDAGGMSTQYVFSKGHLTAKGDFVYRAQQRATYFYINTVPQWQIINGGNWNVMENNVRSLAANSQQGLDIWTGGIGTLQLKDANNKMADIFLNVNEKNPLIKNVPVPKILYKVVYDSKKKAGVVFLTANNPYLKGLGDYQICTNVCAKVKYIKWRANIPSLGLSYCCEIDDFRKIYKELPLFATKSLLTS